MSSEPELIPAPVPDVSGGLLRLVSGLPGTVYRCDLDEDWQVLFMSDRIQDLCGYPADRFQGHTKKRLEALIHPEDRRRFRAALNRSLRTGEAFAVEHRIVCCNGDERWVHHRGCINTALGDNQRVLDAFVIDVTERKFDEQQLTYLANHDHLTGLANRMLFMERAEAAMKRADRDRRRIACLFIDLDQFKRVNDSFGHTFGDDLLVSVANRLRTCIRGNDVIGRIGGDEFTVLLDGIREPQDAATAAEKIMQELSRPFWLKGRRVSAGASIGIGCYPDDSHNISTLLRHADAAMYSVKKNGRCGYRFYSPDMSGHSYEALTLTTDLRSALANDELSLAYQPRIHLISGKINALESLARWNSPDHGMVHPAKFIPLAEEAGLIDTLGHWVLDKACRQAMAWQKQGIPPIRISVNISPRQFRDENLAGLITEVLADTGLEPSLLELEITENAMMHDHALAADILHTLESTGVRLAVDDFGTGYSSLNFLKRFPLHCLKVAREFVAGVPDNADDVAITEAIIAMARRLNLSVIAEGIETEAQCVFVRSNGCDEAQGFLFSHPLDPDATDRFLRRGIR